MRLDTIPNKRYIRVRDTRVPPGAPQIHHGERLFFDHIDGAYSYCLRENGDEMEVVHLAAWTEVELEPESQQPQ